MNKFSELQVKVTGNLTNFEASMRQVSTALSKASKDAYVAAQGIGTLGEAAPKVAATAPAIDRVASSAEKLKGSVQGLQGVGSILGTLGVGFGIAELGRGILDATVSFDKYRMMLEATSGSAQQAARQFEQLEATAKLPGLTIDGLTKGVVRLQSAGMGFQESERTVKAFGNALALVGGTAEDLDGVVIALTQIANTPFVQGDEIRQLQERLPQIRRWMIEAFGTARTEDLKKLNVSSQEFLEKITAIAEQERKAGQSTGDDVAKIQQGFTKLFRVVGDLIALPFGGFSNLVGKVRDDMQTLVGVLDVAYQSINRFSNAITDAFDRASRVPLGFGDSYHNAVRQFEQDNALMIETGKNLAGNLSDVVAVSMRGLSADIMKLTAQKQANAEKTNQARIAAERLDLQYKSLRDTLDAISRKDKADAFVDNWIRSTTLVYDAVSRTLKSVKPETPIIFNDLAVAAEVAAARTTGEIVGQIYADTMKEAVRQAQAQFGDTSALDILGDYDSRSQRDASKSPSRDGWLKMGQDVERFGRNGKRALQEISTVLTDLSRGIARSIIEWKGLGDVAVNVAKDIGQAVLRWAIQEGLEKLASLVGGLLKNVPLLGGVFKNLSGAGGSIVEGASSAVGAAGKAAASGVATAGKVAASAITGVVGAVGGVVSAVSGVIGNFQMAGMNKSLDIIVKHTLQTANQLIYGLQPQINQYLPALQGIHDHGLKMLTEGLGVYPQPGSDWAIAGGGGSGVGSLTINFSNCTFNGTGGIANSMDLVAKELRARGVLPKN